MAILTDKLEMRIDGEVYNDYDFSNITLIQEIQKPNEFRFYMKKKTLQEDEADISFSISNKLLGKKLECSLKTIRYNEKGELCNETLEFVGIIFNVNSLRNNVKAGLVIEVTAFSPDYLLNDSPHCYSYENQNLENIVSFTIEPYKMDISNSPMVNEEIPYIVQYNETNYQFLNRLAQRFGEWFYYNGKELVFGKIKKLDCEELYPGYDILNYQYRLNMGHMNFSHGNHEYLEYKNTKSQANSFTKNVKWNTLTETTFDQSESAFIKETFQTLHCSVPETNLIEETELSVKLEGFGRKANVMICRGTTNRADLRIGSIIKIKEYFEKENKENGFYYHDELLICKITHSSDINGNYENEFVAIPASCENPPYSDCDLYPKTSTQRAVVVDNKDPEKLGRVRVQFLWQKEQDDSLITPWIRIAQPHGGSNKGFYFIPEIDEEVMVGFEMGNAEKPYVIGTLYQGVQRPGSNWYNETNDIKAIRTRNGHTVEIYDEGEGGYIRIYDNEKENYILTFSTDEKLIKLESTGNIELYADNDIIMEAGNNINMKAAVDMNRDAGENISETAGKSLTVDIGENITETAGKNRTISVTDNDTLNVGDNIAVSAGKNMDIDVAEKYTVEANDILQDANAKVQMYAGTTWEQKSDSSMNIDGGSKTNIAGDLIKIS